MREKEWPRGWVPDAAQRNIGNPYDSGSTRHRQSVRCELYGVNIVDRFERKCPFSTVSPLETLRQVGVVAWRTLGRGFDYPESGDASAVLHEVDLCVGCVCRNMAHPTVRRLREKMGVAL